MTNKIPAIAPNSEFFCEFSGTMCFWDGYDWNDLADLEEQHEIIAAVAVMEWDQYVRLSRHAVLSGVKNPDIPDTPSGLIVEHVIKAWRERGGWSNELV